MKMKGMIANTPCNGTFFTGSACLICLALNAKVHYVVSANCTIINHNILKSCQVAQKRRNPDW